MADDGFDNKLAFVETAWRPALDEFVQLFIDLDRPPSDVQLEALGTILGSSHNEVRAYIAAQAAAQGSSLLAGHLRT